MQSVESFVFFWKRGWFTVGWSLRWSTHLTNLSIANSWVLFEHSCPLSNVYFLGVSDAFTGWFCQFSERRKIIIATAVFRPKISEARFSFKIKRKGRVKSLEIELLRKENFHGFYSCNFDNVNIYNFQNNLHFYSLLIMPKIRIFHSL